MYGDASQTVHVPERLGALAEKARQAKDLGGLEQTESLTSIFVLAAELAQGLIDAQFNALGIDEDSLLSQTATSMLMGLAEAMGGKDTGLSRFRAGLDELQALPLPLSVQCARAEGYAFYALYPEAFLQAGAALADLAPVTVVGIRSIGLGLAALVAAGAGAPPPSSVRPVDHPFARKLRLSTSLAAKLADPEQVYGIVDEGPGLSGSSFGAVLDRLEQAGVPRRQIHVFPSHTGDIGAMGSVEHRTRWAELKRHVVSFETLVLDPPEPEQRLENWFADSLGEKKAALRDLSGGNWRSLRYKDEADWPAANLWGERRKYLLQTERGKFLLKFSGLGPYGEVKRLPARRLSLAGFTPQYLAFRHGFLAEAWLEDAVPLDTTGMERERLIVRLADYLAFRAHSLPAPSGGASLQTLSKMLTHNAGQGLAESPPPAELDRFCLSAEKLSGRLNPIMTDNRLHRFEWLVRGDGILIKTDALDHAMAHDLVGCQDLAWDVAGAMVEFALDPSETAALITHISHGGTEIQHDVLRFLHPCYIAFQLGSASLSRGAFASAPDEARRHDRDAKRYGALLEQSLKERL